MQTARQAVAGSSAKPHSERSEHSRVRWVRASRVTKERLALRREPHSCEFLSGTKASSSPSWGHAENANPEGDEAAYVPASFLAVAFFSSLLVSRSGSSMRKSFALCEAFGLTPCPSPWIPPFQDAARSAREGLSAGSCRRHSRQWRRGGGSQGGGGPSAPRLLQYLTPPPARLPPGNAHTRRGRPSAPCTALRAARCKCRYGLLREGQGWGWRTTTAVRHAPVARP